MSRLPIPSNFDIKSPHYPPPNSYFGQGDEDEPVFHGGPRPSLVKKGATTVVITFFVVTLLWMGLRSEYSPIAFRDTTASVVNDAELLEMALASERGPD